MTMTTEDLYARVRSLLQQSGVAFVEVEHEPVLDYERAAEVRRRFDLRGVESKNLFLKAKDGRYFMFVSVEGQRVDFKEVKRLTGRGVSVSSDEELRAQTGCEPGCAAPFGHAPDIGLIIDREIFRHERFIFSPGPPTKTVELAVSELPKLLSACANPLYYYGHAAAEPA